MPTQGTALPFLALIQGRPTTFGVGLAALPETTGRKDAPRPLQGVEVGCFPVSFLFVLVLVLKGCLEQGCILCRVPRAQQMTEARTTGLVWVSGAEPPSSVGSAGAGASETGTPERPVG